MRSTGIPDTNGIVIKEGDILEGWCNSHKLRGQVFWNGFELRIHELYRLNNNDKWIESGEINNFRHECFGMKIDYNESFKTEYRIIGNIIGIGIEILKET